MATRGNHPDGVANRPASRHEIYSYCQTQNAIATMHVPILVSKPHKELAYVCN